MGRLSLGTARLMVRLAARRVPPHRRDRFQREWEGELATAGAHESPGRLLGAAWGAFADARTLRHLDGNGRGGSMGTNGLNAFLHDVAIAFRGMRRAPGFTVVAVLTLALGLGGSAALYTLLDRVVLSPLPYPEADRLVRLDNQVPGVSDKEIWSLSTAQWVYFTDHASTLDDVGLYRVDGGNMMTSEGPQRVRVGVVTQSMMGLLGAEAVRGRVLAPDDDLPTATVVAMLSQGFWERVLGGDAAVVGTTVTLDGNPVEVIGILREGVEIPGMPPSFAPDLWLPLRVNRNGYFGNNHAFSAIARLATDATPEGAARELANLTTQLPEAFPDAYSQSFFDRYGFSTRVTPLKESVLGDLARNLWILFGGVGLVLVIACTNVANLFVVRMEGRRRELGIRSAMGARRGDLARYVLAEGLTLAALGAGLALLVAYWAVPALTALAPVDLPRVHGAALSWPAAGLTAFLALVVGVVLAVYPLLAHVGGAVSLAEGGRTTTAGRRRRLVRDGMVVGQVALALTLVVGSGLLLESLARLRNADAGVDARGVLTAELYLTAARHPRPDGPWNAYRDILARVRAIPGVAAASMTEELPVSGGFGCTVQGFQDATVYDLVKEQGRTTCAGQEGTAPGYFEAMGIPLLEGRTFTDQDNDDPSRGAVVVSRAFAERFWPGRSALGQGVGPSGNSNPPFYHVIGVVGDVARSSADGEAPLSQPAMAIYYPMHAHPHASSSRWWWPGAVTLVVKSELGNPSSLFPAIRRAVAEVDPEIPLTNLGDMETVVAGATSELAFVSLLLGIAAATALLLAAVGLYGVISYVVTRRTREIGMRMAVGAQPGEVRRMVVRNSMALVAIGLAAGVALALLTTGVMEGLLWGVEPTDPTAFAAAAGVLTVVALAASWIPARRASRIDPMEALRAE